MSPADESRVQEMLTHLRAAGHRLTPQRLAVVRALVGLTHPTVEQVHTVAVSSQPSTGLATVYNTLDLLAALGEVAVLDFGEGRRRYDARRPEPHAHLICLTCGQVEDVDASDLARLPAQIAERAGYRLVTQRIDLRGLCPLCQGEAAASAAGAPAVEAAVALHLGRAS